MNTQTQEALHKALKVLNCLNNNRVYETAWVKGAINACEEALAQPAQEVGDAEIKQMLDDIEYYQKRIEELEQPAQEPVAWEDKKDEWSAEIDEAHPVHSHQYKIWETAQRMVSNRHSKHSLVALVCWLLQKDTHPTPSIAQEPVAWMSEGGIFTRTKEHAEIWSNNGGKVTPVYTHPAPSWQGLESEKVTQIIHGLEDKLGMPIVGAIAVARAIEQALKEKNT